MSQISRFYGKSIVLEEGKFLAVSTFGHLDLPNTNLGRTYLLELVSACLRNFVLLVK